MYILGSILSVTTESNPPTHTHMTGTLALGALGITSLCISDRVECCFLLQFLQAASNATSTKGEMVHEYVWLAVVKSSWGPGNEASEEET